MLPEDELKVPSPYFSHLLPQLKGGHYAQNLLKRSLIDSLAKKKKKEKEINKNPAFSIQSTKKGSLSKMKKTSRK